MQGVNGLERKGYWRLSDEIQTSNWKRTRFVILSIFRHSMQSQFSWWIEMEIYKKQIDYHFTESVWHNPMNFDEWLFYVHPFFSFSQQFLNRIAYECHFKEEAIAKNAPIIAFLSVCIDGCMEKINWKWVSIIIKNAMRMTSHKNISFSRGFFFYSYRYTFFLIDGELLCVSNHSRTIFIL